MNTEVTNPSPVVGAEQNVPSSTSNENAASATSLKDVVKTLTGRDYENDEKAAEAIKNTFTAVTSRHQPIQGQPQVQDDAMTAVQELRQQLKVTSFYADHPEYKDAKDIIQKFGGDPEQVVTDPTFQKVYGALKTSSESQNKSVLTSNSRLAMPHNDDYAQDLQAMREGKLPAADFMAKHKGVQRIE